MLKVLVWKYGYENENIGAENNKKLKSKIIQLKDLRNSEKARENAVDCIKRYAACR